MKSSLFLPVFAFLLFQVVINQTVFAQGLPNEAVEFINPDSVAQLLSDSTTGDWQIGIPQKEFFGDAYSQPYAIMTDTIQPFTANTTSSFILKFANSDSIHGEYYSGKLCFQHKLQSEEGSDFAQVALSSNQGEFWSDFTTDQGGYTLAEESGGLVYTPDFYSDWYYNGNDSLYGFTGVFEEYRKTCLSICWYWPIIQGGGFRSFPPDSLLVKFTFISGENTAQNAGWIIDDVTFSYYECIGGLSEHHLPPLEVYPQPANDIVQFYKPENTSSDAFLRIFNALGQFVKELPYLDDKLSLDVQGWGSGLYTYVLYDKEVPVNVGKIIVTH